MRTLAGSSKDAKAYHTLAPNPNINGWWYNSPAGAAAGFWPVHEMLARLLPIGNDIDTGALLGLNTGPGRIQLRFFQTVGPFTAATAPKALPVPPAMTVWADCRQPWFQT